MQRKAPGQIQRELDRLRAGLALSAEDGVSRVLFDRIRVDGLAEPESDRQRVRNDPDARFRQSDPRGGAVYAALRPDREPPVAAGRERGGIPKSAGGYAAGGDVVPQWSDRGEEVRRQAAAMAAEGIGAIQVAARTG